jgi:hypothetical protein
LRQSIPPQILKMEDVRAIFYSWFGFAMTLLLLYENVFNWVCRVKRLSQLAQEVLDNIRQPWQTSFLWHLKICVVKNVILDAMMVVDKKRWRGFDVYFKTKLSSRGRWQSPHCAIVKTAPYIENGAYFILDSGTQWPYYYTKMLSIECVELGDSTGSIGWYSTTMTDVIFMASTNNAQYKRGRVDLHIPSPTASCL